MKKTALGKYGAQFFALMQMRRAGRVHLGELQSLLGLTSTQEQSLLMRLAKNGYIFRLQKAIYLIPPYLPTGGSWQPNELYIISQYMEVQQANYFVGGQYMFHYYGFTQQIVSQLTVYNDKISGTKSFGKLSVHFVKIPSHEVIGYTTLNIGDELGNVNIATPARTVFDAINDIRYRLLPDAYLWLEQYVGKEPTFLKRFFELLIQCGKKNTIRRIGYYLEKIGMRSGLKKLSNLIEPTTAWVCLVPNNDYRGKGLNNKKWGIIDNAEKY